MKLIKTKLKKSLTILTACAISITMLSSCVSAAIAGVSAVPLTAAVVASVVKGIGEPPTEEEKARNKQDAINNLRKIEKIQEEKEGATVTLEDKENRGGTKQLNERNSEEGAEHIGRTGDTKDLAQAEEIDDGTPKTRVRGDGTGGGTKSLRDRNSEEGIEHIGREGGTKSLAQADVTEYDSASSSSVRGDGTGGGTKSLRDRNSEYGDEHIGREGSTKGLTSRDSEYGDEHSGRNGSTKGLNRDDDDYEDSSNAPVVRLAEKTTTSSGDVISTVTTPTPVTTTRVGSYTSDLSVIELILAGHDEEAKEQLLETGKYNQQDSNGLTSLHAAAMANNAPLVTWLLEKGADSEILNDLGDTPIFTAIRYDSVDAAQALVDGGANYFATNADGKMAFLTGIEKGHHFYPVFVIPEVDEVRDTRGQTIVHYFTRTEDIDGMALSIERDLQLDIRDNNGLTPLALAYEAKDSTVSAAIAAALVLAGVSPMQGEWAYFENTVMTRNARQTFEDDQSPLHLSVAANHFGITAYLIACGSLLDARDISGATPLHLAVRYGRTNMVAELLANGADVNACDNNLKTPLLITAPKETQEAIYPMLLEAGAEASVQDIFGDSVLHIATLGNMEKNLVSRFINAGALVNAQNKKGLSPLAEAVEQKNIEHIQLYVSYGADIFSSDANGNTPLIRCLSNGNILKMLVCKNNVNVTDPYGNTALHIALENKATAGSVRYLLDAGIDVNARNCYGETPLFSALKIDNYQGVQQLIKAGATTDLQDNLGNTAMHKAVRWAAEKSLAKLIAAEYSVDIKNQSGKTPLAEAARQNRLNIMKKLVASGANVNASDVTGKTVLMDAIECKNPVAASFLLQKGADPKQCDFYGRNAFHEAASTNTFELIDLVSKTGTNPLSDDYHGRTPFGVLTRSTEQNIACLLTNRNAVDSKGNGFLHVAVIENAPVETFELLLRYGCPIDAQNNAGQTALQMAVKNGMNDVVNLLLNNNADIFVLDKNNENAIITAIYENPSVLTDMSQKYGKACDGAGNSLMHYAAVYAEANVIDVLARYGASKNMVNIANETPLQVAKRIKRPQAVINALQ